MILTTGVTYASEFLSEVVVKLAIILKGFGILENFSASAVVFLHSFLIQIRTPKNNDIQLLNDNSQLLFVFVSCGQWAVPSH